MPGFQSFFRFLDHFVLATLATSSIRVTHSVQKLEEGLINLKIFKIFSELIESLFSIRALSMIDEWVK